MSDPTPDTTGQAPADQQTTSQAPAVDRELSEARKEAARYRTELRKLQEAQEARERETAEAQGQYQKLYETEKARAAELEPARDRADALAAAMEAQIATRLEALPKELRALAPKGDVLDRYQWLADAEKAASKWSEARTPGTPSGPRGNGTVTPPDQTAAERERLRQTGRYNPL